MSRSVGAIRPSIRWAAPLAVLGACLSLAAPGTAQAPGSEEPPRVALVLSGGGARGAAHVGVLKVLEELGVPVDLVVGTSMGAAVGGLYAAGMPVSEIERELGRTDWRAVFVDQPARRDLPFRHKQDDRELLVKLAVGVGSAGLQLPRGLVGGQELRLLLRRLTLRSAAISDFDRLPVRFRAVATDVETGGMVVLGRGDLAEAIRASMAVPGAFAPVELDGRLLVDGGVARNLPVDVARALGAQRIIAVDVVSDLEPRDELRSALDVSGQVLTILTRQNSELQLASLGAGDVLIRPELGRLGMSDFTRVEEAVRRGEEAAVRHQAALMALGGAAGAPRRDLAAALRPVAIEFLRIENDSHLNEATLRRMVHQRPGEPLDPERLQRDLSRIFAFGGLEEASYRVMTEQGRTGVVVRVRERASGTGALRFGLHLSDDWRGNSAFHLLANYTQTGLNSWNGEARVRLQIGQTDGIAAELYQPLANGPWFLAPTAEYSRDVIIPPAGWEVAEYRSSIARAGVGVGLQIENWAELRATVIAARIRADGLAATGEPSTAGGRLSLLLNAEMDLLDDAEFPRHGMAVEAEWQQGLAGHVSTPTYQRLALNVITATSRGPHTLLAAASAGSALGTTLPAYDRHWLGGFLRLSGTPSHFAAGDELVLARLVYLQRLNDGLLLARAGDIHVGASLEAGQVWQSQDAPAFDDLRPAASLILGIRTLLGPLYLAYGWAQGGAHTGYLALGRTF